MFVSMIDGLSLSLSLISGQFSLDLNHVCLGSGGREGEVQCRSDSTLATLRCVGSSPRGVFCHFLAA